MSDKIEYKVGEIFRSYGETVQCVPDFAGNKNCAQCTLYTRDYSCYSHKCHAHDRSDNTSVHYVKVTEPKEGMLFRASDGKLYELRPRGSVVDCVCFTKLTCDMIDRQSFKEPQKNCLHWYPVEESNEKQEEKSKMKEEEHQNRHIEISVVRVEEHIVTFRISRQTHREENFTPNGRKFKSSSGYSISSCSCPEYDGQRSILFVRGCNSYNDDIPVTVPLSNFAKIMQAVTEYNETDGKGYEKPWPQKDDEYFCIDSMGKILILTYHEDFTDEGRRDFGNFFRTREEAEAALEKIKRVLKGDD